MIWSTPLVGFVEGECAVTSDAVYAATDSGLYRLTRDAGQPLWFARVQGLSGSKRVLARGNRVLTSGVGSVQAHDGATGTMLWERRFDVNKASPDFADLAADDALLYVGLRDGRSLALAQSDGQIVWEHSIATAAWSFGGLIGGSTIAGDTLYVTANRYLSANGFEEAAVVVALDRRTGRELWRYQSGGIDSGIGHAAVLAGATLVVTDAYTGYVIAIDAATGVERWRRLLRGFFFGAPVVRGDTVFAATAASRIYALAASDGRTLWTGELDAGATSLDVCRSELFVGDLHVEVRSASSGRRVGLAFEGSAEEIVTSLVKVVEDVAYVGTNRRLIAFRCR